MPIGQPVPQPQRILTITQKYYDQQSSEDLMTTVRVSGALKDFIIGNGITSMAILVDLYQEDIDSFETYLKNIKKTYANVAMPIRISPQVMGRLVGRLFAYSVATEILHYIPDTSNVTQRIAQDYGNQYRQFKSSK